MSKIMKQAAIVLVLSGICMTGGPGTWADSGNPFGFETNTHPLKYEYCKEDKDPKHSGLRNHGYQCSSAPRPHPDFQNYALEFVEDVGLCRIFATSNVFVWGKNLLELEEVKKQIAEKYGPPTSKSGQDYEPIYHWSSEEGFNGLGDVKAIRLSANRSGSGNRLELFVKFALRASQCQKVLDDKAKSAF